MEFIGSQHNERHSSSTEAVMANIDGYCFSLVPSIELMVVLMLGLASKVWKRQNNVMSVRLFRAGESWNRTGNKSPLTLTEVSPKGVQPSRKNIKENIETQDSAVERKERNKVANPIISTCPHLQSSKGCDFLILLYAFLSS